jgi:hypothetical protein
MKIAFIFSLVLVAQLASAATKKAPQEYRFKFNLRGEIFHSQQNSNSYEQAFERAAKACFNYYKAGQKLSEDKGLDIIDTCANPRS